MSKLFSEETLQYIKNEFERVRLTFHDAQLVIEYGTSEQAEQIKSLGCPGVSRSQRRDK